jgi:hypothetical protein
MRLMGDKNMSALLKKIALYVIVILGILYGYKYFTGKSLGTLPAEIVNFFHQQGPAKNANPVYYKNPAEEMPKDR